MVLVYEQDLGRILSLRHGCWCYKYLENGITITDPDQSI